MWDVNEPNWELDAIMTTRGQTDPVFFVFSRDEPVIVIESPDRLSSRRFSAVRVLTSKGIGWCWTFR